MSGGTNSNIKRQNKQIKKQYAYDKKFRDYTRETNLDRYEEAQAKVNLARDQEEQNRAYRDQTNERNYTYQRDLQAKQTRAEQIAYQKSNQIFRGQLEVNRQYAELSAESNRRARDEGLLAATFDESDLNIRQSEFMANATFDKEGNQIKRTGAQAITNIDKQSANLDRSEKLEQNQITGSKLQTIYNHEGRTFTIEQARMDREAAKIASVEA